MFDRLIVTAGLAAAGLALLAPAAAHADTGDQYRVLQPGQSVCVQDTSTAYSSARGEGLVSSGHPVRFTFGPGSPFPRILFDTGSPTTSFGAEASTYLNPGSFPARFQTCAYNQSQKVSYVRLRATALS